MSSLSEIHSPETLEFTSRIRTEPFATRTRTPVYQPCRLIHQSWILGAVRCNTTVIEKKEIFFSQMSDDCGCCVICLEELDDDKDAPKHTLRCNHTFHTSCIIEHFRRTGTFCPHCRDDPREEEVDDNDVNDDSVAVNVHWEDEAEVVAQTNKCVAKRLNTIHKWRRLRKFNSAIVTSIDRLLSAERKKMERKIKDYEIEQRKSFEFKFHNILSDRRQAIMSRNRASGIVGKSTRSLRNVLNSS